MFYKMMKVKDHELIKPLILSYIDKFDNDLSSGNNLTDSQRISKTDWNLDRNHERPYIHFLVPFIETELKKLYESMGGKGLEVVNFWFQQYIMNGNHGWHNHPGCHFSNIYYLEFPEGSPQTEFIDPETGDVVTFDMPSVFGVPQLTNSISGLPFEATVIAMQ
jgi:hypothetical protein